MSKKVLVVGSIMQDLIVQTEKVPSSGESVFGLSFASAPGGKGANQAVAASKAGVEVKMIGKIGNDPFGNNVINAIQNNGVDISSILTSSTVSTGVAVITVEVKKDGNTNSICVVPGSNMDISIDEIKYLENEIKQYSAVILQLEISMEVNEYIAKLAKENDVTVFLNPAPYKPMSKQLLSNVDFIIPNEHEASDITGIKLKETDASRDEVILMGKELLSLGVKNCIITLGKNGSVYINEDEIYFNPAIICENVVDPTAAGDTFIGYFVASYVNGLNIKECMRVASYASKITVSRLGAMPSIPTNKEVEEEMNS